jgi:hypothetical protein
MKYNAWGPSKKKEAKTILNTNYSPYLSRKKSWRINKEKVNYLFAWLPNEALPDEA